VITVKTYVKVFSKILFQVKSMSDDDTNPTHLHQLTSVSWAKLVSKVPKIAHTQPDNAWSTT
jgi:hypothetical protein